MENTTATKEQERKALAQIKKIVDGLGEDSYIAAAFDGCFEMAESNIANDWGESYKEKYEYYYRRAEEFEQKYLQSEEQFNIVRKQASDLSDLNEHNLKIAATNEKQLMDRILPISVYKRLWSLLEDTVDREENHMIQEAEILADHDQIPEEDFYDAVTSYKKARANKREAEYLMAELNKTQKETELL